MSGFEARASGVGRLAVSTSEGAFGTGANSARIACIRPYEIRGKTKMSALGDSAERESLDAYGVLAFRGADAAKFLQGQLSADMEALATGASTLAGLHNPQGRVVAVLAIARPSVEEFLAALPLQLVDAVAQRLRRFVLRAKVRIEDVSSVVRVVRA